jgi:tetratricopeptide (TPR) repeat protein
MMKRMMIVFLCLWILTGCSRPGEKEFIDALVTLENSGSVYMEIHPGLREELEDIASIFKDDLEQEVGQNEELRALYKKLGQTYLDIAETYRDIERVLSPVEPAFDSPREEGVYNKMRAIRYYDMGMYEKAYESFSRAIELDAGNPVLFYHAGVCAGWVANAQVDPGSENEQEAWFATSQRCYQRALDLDPDYIDALYGYAVLLIIELDQPDEGIVYAEKIIKKEKKNIDAYFLLARGYYQAGEYELALDNYDRILEITTSGVVKERVRALKEQVKDMYYESEETTLYLCITPDGFFKNQGKTLSL